MRESVLIVDDDEMVGEVLSATIGTGGYLCTYVGSAGAAFDRVQSDPSICLVVADIHMPGETGLDLLKHLKVARPEVEVIMITGAADLDSAIVALKLGAYDFIRKPFEGEMVLTAIHRAIEKIHLVQENEVYRQDLERRVREKSRALIEQAQELVHKSEDLRRAYLDILTVVSNSIEAKDAYTLGHTWRVTRYAQEIARELGWGEERLEEIEMGGVLHDIGKIGIPDSILKKPGPLTVEEYDVMKKHPEIGAKMLEGIQFLDPVIPYILSHQERFDGNGYPLGLAGTQIPEQGRLMAIADTFDAITSTRVYRPRQSPELACQEIQKHSGTQFDPDYVNAFFRAWDDGKIMEILSRGGGKDSFYSGRVSQGLARSR